MTGRERRVLAFLTEHPDREYGAADLTEACGIPAPAVVQTLMLLRDAGLVSSRWAPRLGKPRRVHRVILETPK